MSRNRPARDHPENEPPWERARRALGNPLGQWDNETGREVEETREIVYGPDGETPEAERQRRRVIISRDPNPTALQLLARWIARLLMACVVGLTATSTGIALAKYDAPLWAWITPMLAALVAAPLIVNAWIRD